MDRLTRFEGNRTVLEFLRYEEAYSRNNLSTK